MKQIIIIELKSGKKIELTKEEFEELKSGFETTQYVSVPYYPSEPSMPTPPRPWYEISWLTTLTDKTCK